MFIFASKVALGAFNTPAISWGLFLNHNILFKAWTNVGLDSLLIINFQVLTGLIHS